MRRNKQNRNKLLSIRKQTEVRDTIISTTTTEMIGKGKGRGGRESGRSSFHYNPFVSNNDRKGEDMKPER